ncbi:MAG: XkdX family protein, partial [Ruthenibacterium sp.]
VHRHDGGGDLMDWLAKITRWHRDGLWTAAMVQNAVTKGKITKAQYDAILAAGTSAGGAK